MANSIWERFNDIANTEEVAEARAQFVPITEGTYEMKLEEIKADENKDGLPMIKGRFRTDTNKVVFYNQQLQNMNYPEMTAKNVASAVEFISALLGTDVEYTNLGELGDIIDDIPVGTMHTIKVTFGKKDTEKKYPILTCVKQYNLTSDDSDLPF